MEREHAQEVQRARVARILAQHLAVQALGVRQATRLMQSDILPTVRNLTSSSESGLNASYSAGKTNANQARRIAGRPKWPMSAYSASAPVTASTTEPSARNATLPLSAKNSTA